MKQTLFYTCLLLLYNATASGQVQRVKTSGPSGIYFEKESVAAGNKLFITCNNNLYVIDGTDAGTLLLVQNIIPHDLTAVNNLLVFTADDGTHGREPWVSDGTINGTYMLTDINPAGNGIPDAGCNLKLGNLIMAGNQIFFPADDGVHGSELWRTDGTTAGTNMVKDINAYGDGTANYACFPGNKWGTVLNNKLYFPADDSTHGEELWVSDGSAAGTYMMADLAPGSFHSSPINFFTSGTRMFFRALDTGWQQILYVSDGSVLGTHQIATGLEPIFYAAGGNTIFFINLDPHRSIYKIDAQNNVSLYTDTINMEPPISYDIPYRPLIPYNNNVYYLCRNNGNAFTSNFLMRIDAATGMSSIVKASYTKIGQPIVAGNKLWFKAINADSTGDLYYTDGTQAGTQTVAFTGPGRYKMSNPIFTAYVYYAVPGTMGGDVYYTMTYDSTSNLELYKTSIFPTGIATASLVTKQLSVFPNPAQTSLTVTGNHITGIRIYNTTGALVQKQKTGGQQPSHTLDIEQLPPGMYLLTAETEDAQITSIRFEKQ